MKHWPVESMPELVGVHILMDITSIGLVKVIVANCRHAMNNHTSTIFAVVGWFSLGEIS